MSTEINVTVDSGGLLERSKLQTAANRQAFAEGQQRTKAEQTGKEQRLERLAAEGRDAQSNLILPSRARQSALDRFTPQPAARRNGVRIEGLILNADDTVRFEFLEEVGWFIFGGRYFGGIGPSYVFAPEESTGGFTAYNISEAIPTSFTVGIEEGRFGENVVYEQATPAGTAFVFADRFSYIPLDRRQLFNASGITAVWDARTYAAEANYASIIFFLTSPTVSDYRVIIELNGSLDLVGTSTPNTGRISASLGSTLEVIGEFPCSISGPWHQQSVTLRERSILIHANGILLYSGDLAGLPGGYNCYGIQVFGGSLDKGGLGTARLEPRALFGSSNYAVKSVLKYR